MHRKILVTFCATLIAAFAARASTTISVPNTFVAGTPAKAADVNANFTAIVNGIKSSSATTSWLIVLCEIIGCTIGSAGFMPLGFRAS